MKSDQENDFIYKLIKAHYLETSNLDAGEISMKLENQKFHIEPSLIQNRIDEFKKLKDYRGPAPEDQKG